jgi:general secretion pathway protein A
MATLGVLIGAGLGWLGHWGAERLDLRLVPAVVALLGPPEGGAVTAPAVDGSKAEQTAAGVMSTDAAPSAQPEAENQIPKPTALPLGTLMADRRSILAGLLRLWRVEVADGVKEDLCVLAYTAGLRCRGGRGDWQALRDQDRPAMIRLRDAKGEPQYALVTGLDEERVALSLGDKSARYPLSEVEGLWTGDYLWLWRMPPGKRVLIGRNAAPEAVRWLRRTLSEAGIPAGDPQSGSYDMSVILAVRQFQRGQGLSPDGIAGPETLIRLERLTAPPETPRMGGSRP